MLFRIYFNLFHFIFSRYPKTQNSFQKTSKMCYQQFQLGVHSFRGNDSACTFQKLSKSDQRNLLFYSIQDIDKRTLVLFLHLELNPSTNIRKESYCNDISDSELF